MNMRAQDHVLLTGFPSNELARRVLARLVELDPDVFVTCLVPQRFMDQALAKRALLPSSVGSRIQLLEGDVAAIDLGLSGREYNDLRGRVKLVHHCAAVTYSGAPQTMAERVNVHGTCEVVEFARGAKKLERVVHWSTLGATWDRDGVVWEDELLEPESGRLMQTRFRAERVIEKARGQVPVTVLRPAMLAGDSRTGELARIEGAGLLILGLLNAPRDVPVPRPGPGDMPLQVVPIDYAVEAGLCLAGVESTIGRTFQIVDPSPFTLDDALTAVATLVGKPPPRGGLPPPLARALVRMPLVEKLVHAEKALLEELGRDVLYDDRNARPLLSKAGLTCPSFGSYVDKLVAHVKREKKSDRPPAPEAPRA
jgi:hypothetical protein